MLCKVLQVILDCGGDEGRSEGLDLVLLQSLTLLSPNETELARMTGGVPDPVRRALGLLASQ